MKRPKSAPSRRRRAVLRGAVTLAAGLGLVATTSGSAHAAPIRLDYPLSGVTHLQGTGSDLELKPGVLAVTADLRAGTLTADTKLPPAPGSFKMIGAIPVSVTTEFIEPEPTVGTIDLKTGAIKSTTKLILRLKDLKVAGIPTPVGSACQTEVPAELDLTSEPGFNALKGGKLSGTYAIPKFEHCLLATPLINMIIPGDGNSISLTLGQPAPPPSS
ncbi:hypothetical protein ABZ070_21840 [Streptomyces sp. NPDC006283]|uniref:hypothetical protein n=1 Tax=Streptomyces sp. NPDC006283 TaxID=3156741 RepID=UPI0033A4C51B